MIGVVGERSCTGNGRDATLDILASRFMPPAFFWKSVSTQDVRYNGREPSAITPPQNPCSVSIPEIAATLLNAERAFPIPAAGAWRSEEHAGI